MKRRDFLRNTLAGAAALVPGSGASVNWDWITSIPAVEVDGSIEQRMIDIANRIAGDLPPIWEAAVGGHWGIVKEWLRRDPTLINVTGNITLHDNEYKNLPLFHVVSGLNPNVEFLKYLVSLGADVNAAGGEDKASPLSFAAQCNSNVSILEYLVSQGADVQEKTKWGETPLLRAAWRNDNLEVIKYLISKGANVHTKNKWDVTTLHVAAQKNTNLAVIKLLVSQGADVHAKDESGATVLHKVAQHNTNVEILKYLVSQGADIQAKTKRGDTPLHYAACFNENVDVLKCLVAQGGDANAKNNNGDMPLNFANTEEKRCFLREAMVDSMICSIRSGRVDVVDFIVTATPHCAVAIKFDARTMDAPLLVAKGADSLALQICKTAMDCGIPVIERELLARDLFDDIEIGESNIILSPEQMKALLEVIIHIYGLAGRDFFAEYAPRLQSQRTG